MKTKDLIQKRYNLLVGKRDEYLSLAEKDEFAGEDADFYYRKACDLWPRIQELELVLDILEMKQ